MNIRSAMSPSIRRRAPLCVLVVLSVLLVGCQKADEGRVVQSSNKVPESMPPHGGAQSATSGAVPAPEGAISVPADADALPLKEKGSGSLAELERGRTAAKNQEAADLFARGFRLTFTSDQEKRNYAAAKQLFMQALALDPNYAEAYRGLAYAEFNLGFNREAALQNYQKALELKPDYGEAHYALAFLYAMDDLEKGAQHFKRAMELGVPDERNLHDRFYPQVKIETH
jgi:tetratricopeptide (TPR) repeat protein